MSKNVRSFRELDVYRVAMEAAMEIFELSKGFPDDGKYALRSQIRSSSRSVCANIAGAWRKRRYPAAFVNKLTDADAEAAESQVWLEFAARCQYATRQCARELDKKYDGIIGRLVRMEDDPEAWRNRPKGNREK